MNYSEFNLVYNLINKKENEIFEKNIELDALNLRHLTKLQNSKQLIDDQYLLEAKNYEKDKKEYNLQTVAYEKVCKVFKEKFCCEGIDIEFSSIINIDERQHEYKIKFKNKIFYMVIPIVENLNLENLKNADYGMYLLYFETEKSKMKLIVKSFSEKDIQEKFMEIINE